MVAEIKWTSGACWALDALSKKDVERQHGKLKLFKYIFQNAACKIVQPYYFDIMSITQDVNWPKSKCTEI